MKILKNIVLVLVVVAFTTNAYAAAAMTLCDCAEMAQSEMSHAEMMDKKIPCHEMAKADVDENSVDIKQANNQPDQDQNKSTECNKCSCGHCKVPTQASLLDNKAVSDFFSKDLLHPSYDDVNASAFPYGIDYPPKRNS